MLETIEVLIISILVGAVSSLVWLGVILLFGGSTGPMYSVALLAWSGDEDAITRRRAVIGFVLIGALGGLGFVYLWPVFAAIEPLGVAPSNAAAVTVAIALYALYVEIGARWDKDEPEDLQQRTAWLAGAAVYAAGLFFGIATLTGGIM